MIFKYSEKLKKVVDYYYVQCNSEEHGRIREQYIPSLASG